MRAQRLTNSVPVPEASAQRAWPDPPRVSARLVWLHDGEQWCDTIATAWAIVDGALVAEVVVDDPRRRTPTAWLSRPDVVPW